MSDKFVAGIRSILEQEGIPEGDINVSLSSDPAKAQRGMYLVLVDGSLNREVATMLRQVKAWVVRSGLDSDVYVIDFKHEVEDAVSVENHVHNWPGEASFHVGNHAVSGSEEFVATMAGAVLQGGSK